MVEFMPVWLILADFQLIAYHLEMVVLQKPGCYPQLVFFLRMASANSTNQGKTVRSFKSYIT